MTEVPQSWTACVDGVSLEVKPSNSAKQKGDGFDRYTLNVTVEIPRAIKYVPHSHSGLPVNGVDTVFSWLKECSFADSAQKEWLRGILEKFAAYFGHFGQNGSATFRDEIELTAPPPRPKGWPGC